MQFRILGYLTVFILLSTSNKAQQVSRVVHEQCATMERLQLQFARNPKLKLEFEQERIAFTKSVKVPAKRQAGISSDDNSRTSFSIPVVFHIVSANPDNVTDAKIRAQLDTLNKDFFGSNGDSTKVPSYFKTFFGRSGIQFCLAQQTPTGEATSGIERIKTTQTSFTANNDGVKHTSTGGANSWDPKKYLNVWVCTLSNSILGYATFPDDTGTAPDEQGVVIETRSLPGGSLTNYNGGKTLTHETGHYFNLYHIWGDDNGSCFGSDDVGDTPNQADATTSGFSGIKTDSCTKGGNGIMYQNYMDYSFDTCLVMFTTEQVTRMESALVTYRSSLLSSKGCVVPIVRDYDARLLSIEQPSQRVCNSSFIPSVTIKNQGSQTLTSLNISSRIDNGSITSFTWKGSLAFLASTIVSLNSLNTTIGKHTITIFVSNPDERTDEDVTNDTISTTIQFYNPQKDVAESFEGNVFPPEAWDIVNPDYSLTWKRVSGVSKTGTASVMMDNYNYNSIGEMDDLRLPNVTLQNSDSAFLSFQVAAAVYTDPTSANNVWDTLQVLASIDCGQTYTSIYKKYGSDLITRKAATTTEFIPEPSEWRKDSINLAGYIGQNNVVFSIRNTNGYENNIYLDDIHLRTVTINPNLKSQGILVTPNPTSGSITVQFYPQPANLKALQVFSMAGQKLEEISIENGPGNNIYNFNVSKHSAGVYIIRAVFADKIVTRKILKY